MKATKQQVLDAFESLSTAMVAFSLLALNTQTLWPMPGFVLPHWVQTACFICALLGAVTRLFSKPCISILELFVDFGVSPAQSAIATKVTTTITSEPVTPPTPEVPKP